MKVSISKFAWQEILRIAEYIQEEFGDESRKKFMQRVRLNKKMIGINPNIGIIEPTLSKSSVTYRSIIVGHLNKMIYRFDNKKVTVVDFWDCRRNPNTLAAQVMRNDSI